MCLRGARNGKALDECGGDVEGVICGGEEASTERDVSNKTRKGDSNHLIFWLIVYIAVSEQVS